MKNTPFILIGPMVILIIWWIFTFNGLVNPLFLPTPSGAINKLFVLLAKGEILQDIAATLIRVFAGFIFAALLGVPMGLFFGWSARFYASFELVIDFFRSLPSTALFPLFLLVFGIGDLAKIAVATFVSFWIILISTASGVLHSSKIRHKAAQSLDASPWQILINVTLMEALPYIATSLKVAASISFIVIIVTEMFIGTNMGLGRRIYDAYLTYKIADMYAVLILSGLLAYFLNKFLSMAEHRLIHWTGK